jgi:hypothetical protein
MRTTLDLADHLLVQAKQLAAARRMTLTAVLEDSLRVYLATEHSRARPASRRMRLPIGDGGRPCRGVDLCDTSALLEIP